MYMHIMYELRVWFFNQWFDFIGLHVCEWGILHYIQIHVNVYNIIHVYQPLPQTCKEKALYTICALYVCELYDLHQQTSFPFVSPFSNHSTVALLESKLIPLSIEECTRPKQKEHIARHLKL